MTSIQVANLQFGSASQFRQYIFYVSYTNYKKVVTLWRSFIYETLTESLILAQDERWRHA